MFAFGLPFFFVFVFSTTTTTTSQPYLPNDLIFLDCGSPTAYNSSSHQRWEGDQDTMFVPLNINTTSFSSIPDDHDFFIDDHPYSTARFFNTSPFTYTFPVSTGPKFLRLHFYPTTYRHRNTYNDLNTEQSFFSVSSNGYSLLTNFSAFLDASFLAKTHSGARINMPNIPRIVKEFLIHVNDTQILYVTFTPSRNSLAFINGIEVVSMPENLYFKNNRLNYVGMSNRPLIDNNTTLENIYRLNMGGEQISVIDDTGIYRSWDQDDNYVYESATGLTPTYYSPVIYTKETPSYTAPELVYQTQRSIGNQSHKYNLTWILPVDSGFYYMFRLHFCNFIPQYTKKGDVTFRIFINNQTVVQEADVFNWTQGSGYPVAVFKDYIVFVNDADGRRSKQDFWLAMHPNPNHEAYSDAYLNGLEAFKLNVDNSLASPNPELSSTTSTAPIVKWNNKKPPYVMIIGGIGGALVLMSILVFIVLQQRRRAKHYGAADNGSSARSISLKQVKEATDEFSESFVIGNGGFGKVYKGYMDNNTTIVAIKRLDSSSRQGFQEFRTEIKMLSKLRHAQLVYLIGYCDDEREMC